MPRRRRPPSTLSTLAIVLSSLSLCLADPAIAPFSDCFSGNVSQKLNVSTVYAQITHSNTLGRHLNLTVFGDSPLPIEGLANNTNSSDNEYLATLFSSTEMLTFSVQSTKMSLCSILRPPSPLPPMSTSPDNITGSYCPVAAGPFALSSAVQLSQSHELTTLQTRLRAVDPLSNELLCIDIASTPLQPGAVHSVYGHARIVLWCTVALAAAYWLLVGISRISTAWGRRAGWSERGWLSRLENAGFIVASAVSGEGLSKSPALMRFATPSLRDIFVHTQWCAALGMVAVQWPLFVYITLAQGKGDSQDHWNPVATPTFQPPSNFADQLSDQNSPLFIDTSVPNILFTLPTDASPGLSSFAYTIGVRPQDLFGICLVLFLAILASTIVLSCLLWGLDVLGAYLGKSLSQDRRVIGGARSPRYSATSKDLLDGSGVPLSVDEERSLNSHFLFSRFPATPRKHWKLRPDFSSLHFSVLHGNLVRLMMYFHLPVTIFSCYQMTLGRPHASLSSIILAAISFAIFSVIIPALLITRLFLTPTSKLYDDTWTLLSLGPLYNHYRHGSQLFACLFFATSLAFGILIGCGQKSGTAQAIVILVIEVISALVTSVWLPWGHGASMGLISFLFCVARIVVAVLLVILTPTVSIGSEAGQWVAYVILFILALIYLAFLLMLVSKVIEAGIRIFGRVGFDRSRHAIDGGLLGVCGMLGCCGTRKRRSRRHRSKLSDLPLTPPNMSHPTLNKGSTPTPSVGPPSVLRPEHALRPYKEESDDEAGYIMGAWQPFPRPGYNAVDEYPPTGAGSGDGASGSKSGFSRVGGGRAHFESPYAIASGSTLTFPSVERNITPQRISDESTISRRGPWPRMSRTKSQTAIIEDTAALARLTSRNQISGSSVARRQSIVPDIVSPSTDDDVSELQEPKKKYWFQLRKPRRHSEGDDARPEEPPRAEGEPGRSFVVVRNRRASQPLARTTPPEGEGSAPADGEAPKSFVVVRKKSPGK
ncbi:hypothetical protein EVG20_g3243 [Dentipellis fragilis]|uniref:TRP C-terminal domain-containing protein n=1 Tax=Dentipellis fragilis TaxID=205917 RepID=A0A4Y9Z3P5_9AGAM|nr:hypothetical protein EVG20_g3243 [Dentipellis fragilis]